MECWSKRRQGLGGQRRDAGGDGDRGIFPEGSGDGDAVDGGQAVHVAVTSPGAEKGRRTASFFVGRNCFFSFRRPCKGGLQRTGYARGIVLAYN